MFAKLTAALLVACVWLTIATVVRGDDAQDLQKQLAEIQAKIDKLSKQPPFPGYEKASQEAVRQQKPLIFFYGTGYPRAVPGCVVGRQDYGTLPGWEKEYGNIIVSVPGADWLVWKATLPPEATDAEILAATTKARQVSQPAGFFQPAERDDSLGAEVSAILSGMQRYSTTRVAQVSGNRSGRGSNSFVSRLVLPSKWQSPGGLDGLTGWSNRLYRLPNNPVTTWKGHVDPRDRWADGRVVGEWGGLSEITYQRQYGTGAKFADVLMTPRGVFEVRIAERVADEWKRSVPYREKSAEPTGYVRVSLQQCASCHDEAGAGEYGTARIIGGGGVLSEPLGVE